MPDNFFNKVGNDPINVVKSTEVVQDQLGNLINSTKRLAERSPENLDLKRGCDSLNDISSNVQSVVATLNIGIKCHN